MRRLFAGLIIASLCSVPVAGQAPGKWPPDSLVNVRVIPKSTPVMQVVGQMRNITGDLGVRCQFCHVGEEGQSLERFDFGSDQKRTKVVARQMMLMVQEINRRLDSLPARPPPLLQVTCATCHRGTNRPVPLSAPIARCGSATTGETHSTLESPRSISRHSGSARRKSSTRPSPSSALTRNTTRHHRGCLSFAGTST